VAIFPLFWSLVGSILANNLVSADSFTIHGDLDNKFGGTAFLLCPAWTSCLRDSIIFVLVMEHLGNILVPIIVGSDIRIGRVAKGCGVHHKPSNTRRPNPEQFQSCSFLGNSDGKRTRNGVHPKPSITQRVGRISQPPMNCCPVLELYVALWVIVMARGQGRAFTTNLPLQSG